MVFVADHWGRHPSSAQYIAGRLPASVDVLWLETVGLTQPTLDRDSLMRGVDQIRRWIGAASPAVEGASGGRVRVLSPSHWPAWTSPRMQRWNGRLLARAVAAAAPPRGRRILVTALPLGVTLLDDLNVDRVVYYCVDDFSVWPGAAGAVQADLERRLLQRSDVVLAASRTLQERIRAAGYAAHFLPHGVDADHWRPRAEEVSSRVALPPDLPRPLLMFWGLIDRRLDTEWVRACQRACGGTVVLLGPQRTPDPTLLRLPGVWPGGPVDHGDLPAYAALSDVLVMPYADLPVTRSMQPLKLLEYLCTDRPVILRDLPACREWSDAADVVATTDALCGALRARLRDGVPAAQMAARSRLRARERSWECVADRFWDLAAPERRKANPARDGGAPRRGRA